VSDGDKPKSGPAGTLPMPKPATDAGKESRYAADDPTDVWDEQSLREKGFDALADAKPSAAKGPATAPRPEQAAAKVVVSPQPVPPAAPAPAPSAAGGVLSWPMTIGIAIAVAIAVYVVVRLLR
jgi:hypothetical protein